MGQVVRRGAARGEGGEDAGSKIRRKRNKEKEIKAAEDECSLKSKKAQYGETSV